MSKEGLVAPVWSDSGEVRCNSGWVAGIDSGVIECGSVRLTHKSGDVWTFEAPIYNGVKFTMDVTLGPLSESKPTDPNAKPALPALTRVSGNKRGPGWCDE